MQLSPDSWRNYSFCQGSSECKRARSAAKFQSLGCGLLSLPMGGICVLPHLLECHVQLPDLWLSLCTHAECTCVEHAEYVILVIGCICLNIHNCF